MSECCTKDDFFEVSFGLVFASSQRFSLCLGAGEESPCPSRQMVSLIQEPLIALWLAMFQAIDMPKMAEAAPLRNH